MRSIVMDGAEGFKRIFAFLVAQAGFLLACVLCLAAVVGLSSSTADVPIATLPALVLIALAMVVMRAAWAIGISGVELFWGTSVKFHVERLMQPALIAGAIALILSAGLLAIMGGNGFPALAEMMLSLAGIGAPLVISALLMISAWRRLVAYRRSHELMGAKRAAHTQMERVDASIASDSGSSDTTVRPNPQGFTFAGLTSKPWHDPRDFPWVAAFEEAVDAITAEYESVCEMHQGSIAAYKYAGLEGDFWKSFQFATRHREIPENAALCPKTTELLKTIPHYPSFRDAMFSILDGGGVIQPHRDVSNVFLTMHLPLIAPGNGFMEVAGLRQEWRRGKAMIFDSSYHHQAQNNSNERRVVLLVDFLHPELTDEEAAWVREARL